MSIRLLSCFSAVFLLFSVETSATSTDSSVVYIRVFVPGSSDPIEEGSGFLVSNEGHIVTAKHVVIAAVELNASITVSLKYKSNNQVSATVFRCDKEGKYPDVCIIRISGDAVKGEDVPPFENILCRNLIKGEELVALGYAFGKQNTLFTVPGKIIGGLGEFDLYPSNLALTYGMSGGPILDFENNVIGVVAGGVKNGTHGYFTPISQIASKLIEANVKCSTSPGSSVWKPGDSLSLSKIKTADIQVLGVDDVMSVKVNDTPVEHAVFGTPTPWRDIKPLLKVGPNGILVQIWNGAYGSCGGAIKVRINNVILPEFSKRWFLDSHIAPFKGNCASELLTLDIEK